MNKLTVNEEKKPNQGQNITLYDLPVILLHNTHLLEQKKSQVQN